MGYIFIYIYMGYIYNIYIYTRDAGPHNATLRPVTQQQCLCGRIRSKSHLDQGVHHGVGQPRLHPGWAKCEKRLNTPNNKEKEIRKTPLV